MAIGDVITILRDGKFQVEAKVCDIDVPWIVREMLGSDPVSNFLSPGRTFGAPVLEAEHITCVNARAMRWWTMSVLRCTAAKLSGFTV
jgi:erythritol transport system ATP-binding protein